MINIFQPNLGDEELERLKKVFDSNWIGKGEEVEKFEEEFASSLDADSQHFTTTTSCTEALYLAAELFKFQEGDEIIVPSLSFVAVGNVVLNKGAKLVLCDVDPHSLNVRASDIAEKITPKTKAVFVTHYGGVPCDMNPILELCREHRIKIIEDAACAPQSFYKGKACGTMGDMGTWSFDAMKIICTGDGGMIYLENSDLVTVAKELLYHGLPMRQKSGMDSAGSGDANWWEIELNRIGRRAIMNNIAAAIGLAQMEKIDGFLDRRKKIDMRYREELSQIGWLKLPPEIPEDYVSSYYMFWIQTDYRDALARYLRENGVYTTFRYWPLHKIDFFEKHIDDTSALDGTEEATTKTLNLPLHQSLSEEEVSKISSLIRNFKS